MLLNIRRLAVLLASALLSFQIVAASDLPRVSFERMTDNSELVVLGKVTRTWTDWDQEHKYIWTHYELAVSEAQKGSARRTVDIAEPGGSLEGRAMSIAGAVGYHVGDNVLVFLSRMPNGYLRTAGFGQGKFVVDSNGRVHGAVPLSQDAVTTGRFAGTPGSAVRSLDGMTVGQVGQLVGSRTRMLAGEAR